MQVDPDGRRAFVSGGFRGIGRELVRTFAAAGMRTAFCGLSAATAADVLGPEAAGTGAHLAVRADVTAPADMARLARAVREHLGGLDVVVCNAGVTSFAAVGGLEPQTWDRVVDTNLNGVWRVLTALLPLVADGASVVVVGSRTAAVGSPASAHYGAAKAALGGLVRSLSRELGPRGIRVNAIAPGAVDTDTTSIMPPAIRAGLVAATPLGRLATTSDVAGVVEFLAGSGAGFVTGQTITIDGGL